MTTVLSPAAVAATRMSTVPPGASSECTDRVGARTLLQADGEAGPGTQPDAAAAAEQPPVGSIAVNPKERRGRPPTVTVDDLVRAAVAVIDEQGMDSLTVRAVAERAGVSPMTWSRHVEDMDHLLQLVPAALLGP